MSIDRRALLGALGTTVAAGLAAPAGAADAKTSPACPFSLGDMPGILARVDALPAEQRDKVRSGNAQKLFDL